MDMKPGYKSTEFWLTVAAMLIGTLLASGAWGEGDGVYKILAFVASALSALGYSHSRGEAKKADALKSAASAASEKPSPSPTP